MGKAVIFDMDGVLSDSEWIYVEMILQVLREKGINIKAEEIGDLFGQSMIYICSELIRRYGLPGEASSYADRVHALRDAHIRENGIYPMPGAVDLVRDLHKRGIPVAVASSAPYDTIKGNMVLFGVDNCIDFMVSGLDCDRGKPWPDIYLKAASLLKAAPEDCIVFEDSSSGVTAAKRAGMFCYAFVPPKAVPQDVSAADEILHSFAGLKAEAII